MRGSMNLRLLILWIFVVVMMAAVGRAIWAISSAIVAVSDYAINNPQRVLELRANDREAEQSADNGG